MERLAAVGSVLYVAAHPDDENTRLLSYLANERLLRTAYLSITRGDGGQNLIGKEQGPLLGLIRTQELLAARRIDGAEQLFTRAIDFGYAKTPEEALATWGREQVLADVVWAIRRFKPDVILTRFPTGGAETHGHHTASALLAEEAFRLAADARYAPEQVRLAGTWQARRLLWNRPTWMSPAAAGETVAGAPPVLKLDIGGYNPLLGVSYGEMAADSRSMHKSQGFGAARTRGPSIEQFVPRLGDPPRQSLFDGLDLTWGRVPGTARLIELLRQARQQFRPDRPEAILPTLLQAQAELTRLPDNPWKGAKLAELAEVVAACAGLWVEAVAGDASVVPGGELKLALTAINRSAAALEWTAVRLPGAAVEVRKPLLPGQPVQVEWPLPISRDTPYSDPYWLIEPPEAQGRYSVPDPADIGRPERPALVAEFTVASGGRTITLRRPVLYRWTDPVAGEQHRPVEITPAVMMNPDTAVLMFPDGQPKGLRVRVVAGRPRAAGTLRLELPPGWRAAPAQAPFQIADKGAEAEVLFRISPPASGTACAGDSRGRIVAEVEGQQLSRGIVRIIHPHIPIQTLFPPAAARLCRFDLRRTRTRIGYIAGAGDDVPAALRQVGFAVDLLDDEALAGQPLSRYEAIVVGVRAYNTSPRLALHHRRLMDYVAAGGTLVVQYSTSNRLGRLTAPIGPYPFEISQDRVTDENAAVTFLTREHPILQRPNRITATDFQGWVQERGLYFAGTWNERYETVLAMNDAGEPPKKGGLLVARHGKGAFIYTGLAFFRQLPAGVSGAYRLFTNLIEYGK